jgi:hypothetical protein
VLSEAHFMLFAKDADIELIHRSDSYGRMAASNYSFPAIFLAIWAI